MRGLILAAGRGRRLGDYADGTPKCLLEVGRRRLVEHQLEALADAGVAPVAMVVGYGADEVRETVGIRAEYIHNRRWDQTNSVYSYHLAREWLTGPIVLLNCDVLFHPEILSRLLAVKGDVLAYDSSSGSAPEHMKVKVENGRVVDMAKDLAAEDASGENLGVLCLSAETAQALAERAGKVIAEGGENTWLSSAVRQLAKERPIQALDVAGLPWGEIDSAYDLEHVRKKVWPAIEGSRRPLRRRRRLAQLGLGVLALGAIATALLGYDGVPSAGRAARSSCRGWRRSTSRSARSSRSGGCSTITTRVSSTSKDRARTGSSRGCWSSRSCSAPPARASPTCCASSWTAACSTSCATKRRLIHWRPSSR